MACVEDDLFGTIFMADDRYHIHGYDEGFEEGKRQGWHEGRNHGRIHGGKLSAEVSFYRGFALTWKYLLQMNMDSKARKPLKILEALTGMIQTFPLEDPQNQELEENMKQIRAKFRQVCSLLHISTDFNGYVNSPGQLSF
ncbi:protein LTO1 homolog isoform X1 [Clupea harengus]|uniref:Protein LTO1 homolog isoform X1 n=1 Tax=Clupea harengus TaxID=7950 RepID=A0A6P3VFG9_CLUHA|nr:protein LTO1 homolog isoform X1 [Clupea harengus]